MSDARIGVIALILACTIWGLSPLFYVQLAHLSPVLVLTHRTLWSLVFFGGVLAVQGRLGRLRDALTSTSQLRRIALAAGFITVNWFVFISAVSTGKAVEASLGYYIFPLVSVALGAVFMKERLRRMQWAAVGLAAFAVILLTVGLRVAPWIALTLAGSFGCYGLIKKTLPVGPVVSVAAEVTLLAPISLLVMLALARGGMSVWGETGHDVALLVASGVVTGLPLVLFSVAARRISMATVGLIQYLNPTLQFLCATLVLREPFGVWYAVAFGLIWTALALYSAASLRGGGKRDRTGG